uniref:TMEM131_like domain-containing protein n=1 Tax=Steinernema glaseri TaxID=37863 RepID=A0A1I7YZI3_9BILA
ILGAGESTTFEVVYLPRAERHVQSTVYIHSSIGVHAFVVVGVGRASPYRIRPFVAAKVPCNGTFLQPITVHNPHVEPLRITEVFSSGGDVHLEMPGGEARTGGDADLWEIPPFATKTVMNAKLIGAQEQNSTSFIAIRTNREPIPGITPENHTQEGTLLVPVDLEITRQQGLFATVDRLDFGLIKAGEASTTLTLEVVSTLDRSLELDSVFVEDRDHPHHEIQIEFAASPPITVASGAWSQPGAAVAVAKLRFNSSYAMSYFSDREEATVAEGGAESAKVLRFRGRIVVSSSLNRFRHNATVAYEATVYYGELLHNPDDIAFHEQLTPPTTRGVSLTNHFPFGLAIYKVLMAPEGRQAFSVGLTAPVVHLAPGETLQPLLLQYLEKRNETFETSCRIFTNVTQFNIPIIVFKGKARVTLYSLDQTQFDFGLVNKGDQRSILFAVTNDNPVPLTIKKLTNALPSITTLELLGLESGNETILSQAESRDDVSHLWSQGSDFSIPPRSFAVFNYTLTVPRDGAVFRATLEIVTNFQRFEFPVRYQVEDGHIAVAPDTIRFSDSFPGQIQRQQLAVYSSFPREMQVLRLSTLGDDRRIFFDSFDTDKHLVLRPHERTSLGNVMFMPEADCLDDCYVGMSLNEADGMWFAYGLELPRNLPEIDSYLYRKLRNKYLEMVDSNRHLVNSTVVVDTSEVKHVHVPVQGELTWPRLLTRSVIHFPLTAVGNYTILNLTLQNPSTKPVIVQLLPLVIYPDGESLVELLRDDLPEPLVDPVEMNETLMFSLRDTELFSIKPESPVPMLREHLEEAIEKTVPRFTLSMMLQPRMKVRIRLGFLPADYQLRSSLLLIRNNLTAIEPVVLYGKGARIEMRIDNRTARSHDPLLFEIQPHHLDDCGNPKRQMHKLSTTLTVKRLFMVTNTGEVPFAVTNMSINNAACENRGFKIINCFPFRLQPNESYALEIAHTPDFLQTWNEANLQIYMYMNGTSWMFPMASSLPASMLAKCHRALPRPPFESLMYYSCVSALVFCLICIVACAYLEGDRTIDTMIRQQYAAPRKVFDLNATHTEEDAENNNKADELDQEVNRRTGRVAYDNDSNVVVRSFWEAINFVLWLFSHVWVFWNRRSDKKLIESIKNEKKKRKKRGPVVKPKEATPPPATPPQPEPSKRAAKKAKAAKKVSDAAAQQNNASPQNGVHKQNGMDAEIRKVESIMDSSLAAPKKTRSKAPLSARVSNDSSLPEIDEGEEFIKVKKTDWLKAINALNNKKEEPPVDPPAEEVKEPVQPPRSVSRSSESSKKARKPRSNTESSSVSSTSEPASSKRAKKKKPERPPTKAPEPVACSEEEELPPSEASEAPDWGEYQHLSDEDLDQNFDEMVAQSQLFEKLESEESTPTHQKKPRPMSLAPLQMPVRFDPLTTESIREAQKQLENLNLLGMPNQLDNAALYQPESLWDDFGLNGTLDPYLDKVKKMKNKKKEK